MATSWRNRSLGRRLGACALALVLIAPNVLAQDANLRRENQRLKEELDQLREQCASGSPATHGSGSSLEQRVGDLGFSIASVRVGQAEGFTKEHRAVTVSMRVRNLGMQPIALNYNQRSFSLVDDLGYGYKLNKEDSSIYFAESIKGVAMATSNNASTDDVVLPGQSLNVTFIAVRYLRQGETIGSHFDLNATFGAFEDQSQGHIRRVRNYTVSFVGVPRGGISQMPGQHQTRGRAVVDRVLNGLLGEGN